LTDNLTGPLALIILDGFGCSKAKDANAIYLANKWFWNEAWEKYPHTLLATSGERVGLPDGQMGNSEVGHMNIGAGRIIQMDISRIDVAIQNGTFFENPAFLDAMKNAKEKNSALHLMGLVSDGGVHSMNTHLYALLYMAQQNGIEKIFVHCFLDGRDTPPQSGAGYVAELIDKIGAIGAGRIASVVGRYYAMDRDKRWDRVQQAYELLTQGRAYRKSTDPVAAIKQSYAEEVGDEFVKPISIVDEHEQPVATIKDGDSVIFFNFRSDRAREITRALTEENFDGFKREVFPKVHYVCMTQYDATFPLPIAFGPQTHNNILVQIFAQHGIKNIRIAETEKYAHVTFFFNGGVEKEYPFEERVLVPSPKVATYDMQPEMSAYGITDEVLKALNDDRAKVFIINFANADMVGHTGMMGPAIRAIENVDICLGKIVPAFLKKGGAVLITADHGNAEEMEDPETGEPQTAHTTNPVPLLYVNDNYKGKLRSGGALEDIAPTMLGILGIEKPLEMTGTDLRES